MKKLNKKSILFFIFSLIFFTYLTSGLLVFFLNSELNFNLITLIGSNYDLTFTYKAITRGYPRVFESIFYSLVGWSLLISLFMFFGKDKKSLHGEARFATKKEIEKMGLLQDKGLIVGKLESGELLKWKSSEFLSLGAPTRSGKGVSIVIPNLMEWEESCVVLDIKQECFDFSSKYRRDILGQEVYLFNPFDFRTHRYNPLTYIDLMDEKTIDNDLLDFVTILYPLSGNNDTDFWPQQAQNLFIGLAYLYRDLALTDEGKSFLKEYNFSLEWSMSGLLRLSIGFEFDTHPKIDDDGETIESVEISGLEDTFGYLKSIGLVSKRANENLIKFFNNSDNTRTGIMSSFNGPLMIYSNNPISTATAKSDFDLRDLRKKKMTIYIGITPDKLAIARPILNVFFSQLLSVNTKELPQSNPDLKYTCLLLLDEFTSIGNMPILKKGVSYIAGFHLRILMIFQAISQLEATAPDGYGRDGAKTLLQNMGVKMYFTPNEFEEAEKISKRLGDTTYKAISKSYNHGRMFDSGSSSHSVSEQRRALMLPQELIELPQSKALLMMTYQKPILCNKAFYYNDKYFIDKFKLISPYMKGKKNLNHKDWEVMLQKKETVIDIPIQILE